MGGEQLGAGKGLQRNVDFKEKSEEFYERAKSLGSEKHKNVQML
jgi:hypothetical protein